MDVKKQIASRELYVTGEGHFDAAGRTTNVDRYGQCGPEYRLDRGQRYGNRLSV